MFFPEGECSPGNVFHLEINLVQSGAPKTFLTRFLDVRIFFMSFSLNESEFWWCDSVAVRCKLTLPFSPPTSVGTTSVNPTLN